MFMTSCNVREEMISCYIKRDCKYMEICKCVVLCSGFGAPRFGGRGLINRPPGPAAFIAQPPFGMHFNVIPNNNFIQQQPSFPPGAAFLPLQGPPLLPPGAAPLPPQAWPGGQMGGQPHHFLPAGDPMLQNPATVGQFPAQQMAGGDVSTAPGAEAAAGKTKTGKKSKVKLCLYYF